MATKYRNSFHCKTIQNLPKMGFLFWKYTIWQPWTDRDQRVIFSILIFGR
jgi:hypothetical protein